MGEDWPSGLEFLKDSGAWFFGVWGRNPLGECACARGTHRWDDTRDHRFGEPGTCNSPGKHPVVWRMADGLHGFPHGWRDAVTWTEWSGGLGADVTVLGGRMAVTVPGDVWVLDVDGDNGWRGLCRLFKAQVLSFADVLAVSKTVRGWHVWVKAEQDGWTSGSAQSALNATLDGIGAVRGLEVKSRGGYVIWPDGVERWWLEPLVFARAVAWRASVSTGRYSAWARRADGVQSEGPVRIGAGMPPPPGELPEAGVESVSGEWTDVQREEWRQMCYGGLLASLSKVSSAPEGARNNRLNAVSWFAGRQAVHAGAGYVEVSEVLVRAGTASGLDARECRATVRSALRGLESMGD